MSSTTATSFFTTEEVDNKVFNTFNDDDEELYYDKEYSSSPFSSEGIRFFEEQVNATKIKSFAALKAGMNLDWLANKDYRIIETKQDLFWAVKQMYSKEFIAFDTETTGLKIYDISHDNPVKDHVVGLCFSWEINQGIYIPIDMINMNNLNTKLVLLCVKQILELKKIICHNGMFDSKVMYDVGIIVNVVHDTAILQFNIDSDIFRGTRKLKGLTEYWLHYTPVEFEDVFEFKKDYRLFRYVSREVARVYACADSDHTLQLLFILLPLLSPQQLKAYKRSIDVILPFMRSEYYGKSIDSAKLQTLNEINNKDLEMVEHLIYRYVGTELAYREMDRCSNEMYRFNINSGPELANVIFSKLHYPKPEVQHKGRGTSASSNAISKKQLEFWSKQDDKTGRTLAAEKLLDGDLMSDSINHPELGLGSSDHLLLSKAKFVKCRYRLSLLITLQRRLFKNKTSFFAPLLSGDTEGKYFSNINMQRAATFRVLDPIQTLDKKLKKVIAPPEGWYQIAADYAQIEARVFAGFAKDMSLVEQLDNMEADYHRLAAAKIENKAPEDITDIERSKYKAVNFGIIYGIGAKGIVDQTDGIGLDEEKYKKAVEEKQHIIDDWKIGMKTGYDALNRCRQMACTPVPEYEIPYTLRGHKAGRVISNNGRTRWFDLDNMTPAKRASIERRAGNFPIQSFALDILLEAVCRFFDILKKEELIDIKVPDNYSPLGYHFEAKVKVMAYIHDEMEIIIHKSINPEWMLKKLFEAMVIRIPGYPGFYIGAGIVKNWYEAKGGDHEVPIQMFYEIPDDVQKYRHYDFCSQEIMDERIRAFLKRRCIEEFNKQNIDIASVTSITTKDLSDMKSYYIKTKVCDLISPARKVDKDEKRWNDKFMACLETLFGHPYEIVVSELNNVENSEDKISVENYEIDYSNIVELMDYGEEGEDYDFE